MASLDYVIDITVKLEKQNIDYALITIQKGKEGDIVHLFHNISDIDSVHSALSACNQLVKKLEDIADVLLTEEEKKTKKNKKKNGGQDGTKGKE